MKASSFKYLLKEGAKNVWFNRLMSFASVGVLTACLLLVGFAILFTINVNSLVKYVEMQNNAVVFVQDSATEQQIASLEQSLTSNSNIYDVRYVSKEQAFERQKELLGADAGLIEGIEKDTFPASFEVRIKDLSIMVSTISQIETLDNVLKVNASPEVGQTLSDANKMVNTFGIAMIMALVIVSIVIIANTIRASVFSRRREINIMKYVGATNGFIRLPFIVEGLLLGLASALLAFVVIWLAYNGVVGLIEDNSSAWLREMFVHIVPFKTAAPTLAVSFCFAGMLTGGLGSAFSIGNHLKV
ncbi:MAG: hypothetical protein K0R90_1258 [Oscillospiraceae bacterium]|jgi:cell division transport system permease protein|nr:hypothetical protein [Oscillospiraceae bacterium]